MQADEIKHPVAMEKHVEELKELLAGINLQGKYDLFAAHQSKSQSHQACD